LVFALATPDCSASKAQSPSFAVEGTTFMAPLDFSIPNPCGLPVDHLAGGAATGDAVFAALDVV
jgi:hypothetical protein